MLAPEPVHAATRYAESARVGDDRRLHRELRPVGERRDHLRSLPDGLGERRLRLWAPVRIDEALDVADQNGLHPDRPHVAQEVHRHARLVAVRVRDHHLGLVGNCLQDRPHCRVELCVDEHDMLPVSHRVGRNTRAELDLSRRLQHDVDPLGLAHDRRILGHDTLTADDGVLQLRNSSNSLDRPSAQFREDPHGTLDRPVCHRDELETGDRDDLIRDPTPHVPRTDNRDADGIPVRGTLGERLVEDDHSELPSEPRARSGHSRSRSDTSRTSAGQSIPSAGSSYRTPVAASGS